MREEGPVLFFRKERGGREKGRRSDYVSVAEEDIDERLSNTSLRKTHTHTCTVGLSPLISRCARRGSNQEDRELGQGVVGGGGGVGLVHGENGTERDFV